MPFIWDNSNSWLQRSWPILSLFETLHEFRKHIDVLEFPEEVVSLQILLIILLINSTITVIILWTRTSLKSHTPSARSLY